MIISTITDYVIQEFQSNPLVNTVSFKPTNEMDYNKANIYPLVNVDLINSVYIQEVHQLNFLITIYQQRDTKPEMNLENKLLNTNQIDNYNETHTIATKFINHLNSYHNDQGIEIFSLGTIEYLAHDSTNLLDGVRFNIVLSMYDNIGC